MQEFDIIKDMIYKELDEISHIGQLDKNAVCVIGELVDILKDIGSIEMFEEGFNPDDEYGYSRDGMYSQRGRSLYDGGNSYRNGGYGRGGSYGYGGRRGGNGGYSRDDARQHMMEKLEHLKNEAVEQHDRESIQRLIDQMRNSN